MAFVEVSTNGRSYNLLVSFTGSSNNWEQKQYSLDDYAGESIFIRFRYITDQNTLEEGFYVDDIAPLMILRQSLNGIQLLHFQIQLQMITMK